MKLVLCARLIMRYPWLASLITKIFVCWRVKALDSEKKIIGFMMESEYLMN